VTRRVRATLRSVNAQAPEPRARGLSYAAIWVSRCESEGQEFAIVLVSFRLGFGLT